MTRTELREWLQTLGLVALPIMVAFTGNAVAKSNATREADARMVEIAAQVLAGPVNDSTRPLRVWALNVLGRHSDVPFGAAAESILIRHGTITFVTPRAVHVLTFTQCDSTGKNCRPLRVEEVERQ